MHAMRNMPMDILHTLDTTYDTPCYIYKKGIHAHFAAWLCAMPDRLNLKISGELHMNLSCMEVCRNRVPRSNDALQTKWPWSDAGMIA